MDGVAQLVPNFRILYHTATVKDRVIQIRGLGRVQLHLRCCLAAFQLTTLHLRGKEMLMAVMQTRIRAPQLLHDPLLLRESDLGTAELPRTQSLQTAHETSFLVNWPGLVAAG